MLRIPTATVRYSLSAASIGVTRRVPRSAAIEADADPFREKGRLVRASRAVFNEPDPVDVVGPWNPGIGAALLPATSDVAV